MTRPFRDKWPVRTCMKTYADYKSYKSILIADFSHKCGYTDCSDRWFGGSDCFHIDHFRPWKKYPNEPWLKTQYSNLVYCCSYVNISKSNDITPNYLDPCNEDYNGHFYRDHYGSIYPMASSTRAAYMYDKMKMYLRRYQIIWILDRLWHQTDEITLLLNNSTLSAEHRALLEPLHYELLKYLKKYLKALY